MRTSLTILLCLLLAGSAVAADRPLDKTLLEGAAQPTLVPAGVCVFGNNPALTWSNDDWIEGNESFAIPFVAEQPVCGCAVGFKMEAVHMSISFGPEDVPVFVEVSASLLAMAPGQPGQCSVPGEELYRSPYHGFNIATAGVYDISIPMDLGSSPCASFDYEYAVSMNVATLFENLPGVVTGRTLPEFCHGYLKHGGTWYDLAQFSVATPALFADIVCCSPVVPSEEKAWGSLKSMYR